MCFELTDRDSVEAEGNLNEKEAEIGLLDNINNDAPKGREKEGLNNVELLLSSLSPEIRRATAKLFITNLVLDIILKYKGSKGKAAIRAAASVFSSLSLKPGESGVALTLALEKATDQFLVEFEEELEVERMLELEEVEEVGSNRGGSEG